MSPLRARLAERSGGALLMGVLNRTPDSFSDGGAFLDEAAASRQIARLLAEGADIVDVGAESTRPGSKAVSAAEQIVRIGGSIRQAVQLGALVSIDTTSVEVAEKALADGASIVNSVSLEPAADLARLAAKRGAALVLMHSRGSMTDMRGFSVYADDAYGDVVNDVVRELGDAAEKALHAGLPREDLVLDPGLGFAKNARHSLELTAWLDEICALGFPVLVGPSRKSFLLAGISGDKPPAEQRLGATIAACIACVERGARIVRVHDVAPVKQALDVAARLRAVRQRPFTPRPAGLLDVATRSNQDQVLSEMKAQLRKRAGGRRD